MKINKSFEQAIYVLLILALEKDHQPLKSQLLSQKLQVSDSYLKKILMTLKRNKLIVSIASKKGGYQLARSADEITLKDVFFALEMNKDNFQLNHLSYRIFDDDPEHVAESEEKITNVLNEAFDGFYDKLDSFKLSDLLKDGTWENGAVEWQDE